ncbi:PDGLE domain-containing protein, partial [Streptomyces sp. NPDC057654]|uniref:PDGLE domain-containing protein n=1 Tax=Streptomyces sp. NPDC057654 TaxID=3346196 RepID=UPI0036853733
ASPASTVAPVGTVSPAGSGPGSSPDTPAGRGAGAESGAAAGTDVGAGTGAGTGPEPAVGSGAAARTGAGADPRPAVDARTGVGAGQTSGVDPAPAVSSAADAPPAPARSARRLKLVGLVAALALAGFGSYYASASPDGLEKVAHDKGIDRKAEDHAAKGSPLADYQVKDVSNVRLAGGLAGVIGVGATLVVGTGVAWTVHRRRTRDAATAPAAEVRERGTA